MNLSFRFDRLITVFYIFTVTSIMSISYVTFKDVIDDYNEAQHQSIVPLFSIITSEILRPLTIAHFMSNDDFLLNYIQQKDVDSKKLYSYLNNISKNYDMLAFIALEKHRFMIDSNQLYLDLNNDKAEWYHRLKKLESDTYTDIGNADDPHIYFDIKLYNKDKEFLGFTGVAIDLNYFANAFKEYQERFGFELYFVNNQNEIVLTSNEIMKTSKHHRNEEITLISTLDWFKKSNTLKNSITNESVHTENLQDKFVVQMPIKELNWQLYVVSPKVSQQGAYWRLIVTRIGAFILLMLVLYMLFFNVMYYSQRALIKKSETDFLTQLPNRSFLHQRFNKLINNTSHMSVVVADIDHFKKINDTYGHLAGDSVLKLVSQLMIKGLRKNDIICRWGGEEFVMLLPGTNIDDAFKIVERMRKDIQNSAIFTKKINNFQQNLTLSFGITHVLRNTESLDSIIAQADDALYQAKSAGRNKVVLFKQ